MRRWVTIALVAAIALLAVFDLLLIGQVRDLRRENATLRMKVLPTLDEQYNLFEHGLEGEALADLFATLSKESARFRELIAEPAPVRLVLYIPGENCRRALHTEMSVLGPRRADLERRGVRPIFVFAGFRADDLDALARQYGIEDATVSDRGWLFRKRFGLRGDPLSLWIGRSGEVLYANVVQAGAAEASRQFYDKVHLLAGPTVD